MRRSAAAAAGLCAAGIAVLGIAALAGSSQDQDQQPPVFRGGTAFVRVDVYPLRDGKPVEDLTADDFEVVEDGKPQHIETFEFVRHSPVTADEDRRDPTSVADSERQAADPNVRVFVVYFDIYHMAFEDTRPIQGPVRTFLQRVIGPADLFGVMTPEVPPSSLTFGRRFETIEGDMAELWTQVAFDSKRVTPRSEVEQALAGCATNGASADQLIRLYRDDTIFTNLEGLMVRLRDLREERKTVLFLSRGFGTRPNTRLLGQAQRPAIPTIGVGPNGRLRIGEAQPFSRDEIWCNTQIARLTSIDFDHRFRDLLELARRSNVAISPVDVAGLQVETNGVGSGIGSRQMLLTLAENTNGIAIVNTNDLAAGVRRLTDSLSAYYLLGYYSTNPRADGGYRRITVRVRRPGISVSARPGYFAPTAEAIAAADAPPPAPPSPVDDALARLARIRSDAELFTYGVVDGTSLRVVTELPVRAGGDGPWADGADVAVTLRHEAESSEPVFARIEPGARAAVVSVPVPPGRDGPFRLDVRATGRDAVAEGRAEIERADGVLFGDPLVYRAGLSRQAAFRPAADLRFSRRERLRVVWPVLAPASTSQARLLDRSGAPLPLEPALADVREDGRDCVALNLPLSAFAEGDYVIELTGTGAAGADRKLLAFRVVR